MSAEARALKAGQLNIGPRLMRGFAVIIFSMLAADAVVLWQFRLVRAQAERLNDIDQKLVAVLRLHTSLTTFHNRLEDLADSQDIGQLVTEGERLRTAVLEDSRRAMSAFSLAPFDLQRDPTILPILHSVESALPAQLAAVTTLANAGDWRAVHQRLANQVTAMQSVTLALVERVDHEVGEEQAQTVRKIERVQRLVFLVVPLTAVFTLLIAGTFGLAITRSITEPLARLVEGSKALAKGDFQHEVPVTGRDELADLGRVFNDTARRLQDLYATLQQSEDRLRLVIDTIPAHVWSASPDGAVDFVNERWQELTGLSPEGALGRNWEAVIHPDDHARYVNNWHAALATGQSMESEVRLRRADGEYSWLFVRNVPLRDERGNIVKWYGTAIDIEDRKQAEEQLRESEARFQTMADKAPVMIWTTGTDGLCNYFSKPWLDFTGRTMEEEVGLGWTQGVHPDDLQPALDCYLPAFHARKPFRMEYRLKRRDGEYRWVVESGVPRYTLDGEFAGYIGSNIDITDRKRAEEALQRSEAYLAEGQRLAKTGSWAYNPNTDRSIYWSEEMRRIFGLDPKTSNLPDREEGLRLVHPEDRDRFIEQIEKAFREKADFALDYRIALPDGTVKHIHGIGHPVLDDAGNIIEYVGTDVDVTQRKHAEEALRRSEVYLTEAQKLTHTGSWAARVPQMENVYWSEEMYRIFGLDPGSTPPSSMEVARQVHPEDLPHRHAIMEQAMLDRTDFESDYRLLLPNGTIKYIHSVGHPVVNASGDVIQLVGTAMDVTEQHKARAALQTAFEQIKAEQTELRRMTDAIAAYIYVLRPDGTALYANQTALDYTGVSVEDLQREDHRVRVFHPEDVERLREERSAALALGVPFENEQRALGKDGKYRWFLVRYNPLRDDEGNIIRWYATGTDIEDRKRAEERMRDENLALREQIDQAFMFEEIVGTSAALQTVVSSIVRVAPTDSTVLITGETGTGKELIARAIHKRSQRYGQAFISVNCASIPSSLIASELFGHEKGAFTGAVQRREGRFELAHSGTIFLDEIGELPAETQIALLRVLQERQFERIGGNQVLHTDVRVIAATNRDLTAAIASGTFRADLFYRLNVFPIELPPLRERREDIPILVEYFVKRYADKAGKRIRNIDKNTLELCQSYPWPGNIRELQNIVERSMILTSGDTFRIENVWLTRPQPARQELPAPLPDTLQSREREIIETALAESKGKVAGREGAAAKLGIPPSTLESKIKQLKIKKRRFISE